MGLRQQNLKFEDVIWELIDQFWKNWKLKI
jgi:hypothetical protein